MPAPQTIFGPYRIKNIGTGPDGPYEVVEMLDNHNNTWEQLRPRKVYSNRQSAYGLCARMNRRWQEDNQMESDLLEYWKDAAN